MRFFRSANDHHDRAIDGDGTDKAELDEKFTHNSGSISATLPTDKSLLSRGTYEGFQQSYTCL